ncbi:MAG: MFS transporter [Microbacterium sp.]
MTQPAAQTAPEPRRWQAFAVCVTVAGLTILDISKVNVALPSIESALSAGGTELQIVVAGYILAFGLVLVPMGRLGDQWSRKILLLIGIAVFGLASMLCALAPTIQPLLIGRLLQGVGGGIIMPQVTGTFQRLFTGRDRAKAFGIFGAIISLGTAFGPAIGGVFIAIGGDTNGWRGIFWMNVPAYAIAFALVLWLLPGSKASAGARRISLDPVGLVIFAVAILSLMVPFLLTTGSGDDNPARWLMLVVFAGLIVLFGWWESRYEREGRAPLVSPALLRNTSYRNGAIVGAAYFAGMPVLFLLTTVFLQTGLHLAALHAGLITVGFAVASAVTSAFSGRLVVRYGRIVVVLSLVGMAVTIAALVVVSVVSPDAATPWIMFAVLTAGGLAGGLVISPNQTLTLSNIPPQQGGIAGSIQQLGQRIGTSMGTAVALSLFYSTVNASDDGGTAVFHTAYAVALAAVGGFMLVALVFAVVDLRRSAPVSG